MGGLTCIGIVWTLLSVVATVLLVGGVLTPEWLVGQISADGRSLIAYFGAYKRCNYPIFDKESNRIALLSECGRYEHFNDVPSHFWQIAIICSIAGACVSLLLVLLLIPSMCMKDIVSNSTALIVGFFQIISAILIAAALVVYPLGWDNPEVKDACGPTADRFALGKCKLGRSYLSLVVGAAMLVFCALLSLCGGKKRKHLFDRRHDVLIQGFDSTRLDNAK